MDKINKLRELRNWYLSNLKKATSSNSKDMHSKTKELIDEYNKKKREINKRHLN